MEILSFLSSLLFPAPRYHDYIQSLAWKIKASREKKAHPFCSLCGDPNNLNVHHNSYERLGRERRSDLTVLCEGCHKLFHRFHKYDSRTHRFLPIKAKTGFKRRKYYVTK